MTPENSQNINVSERYIYEYVYPYRIYKGWGREYQHEICIVSLKNKPEEKKIRFRKRYFGVSRKMKTAGETQPRWVYLPGFNLNPKKEFSRFFDIIQKIKEGKVQDIVDLIQSTDFNLQANNLDKLSKILKNYSVKKRRTKKDIIERTRMQQEIAQLSEKVNVLSDKNRRLKLQSFKNKTPDYRKILKRIKSDLERESHNEPYFQAKFTENKWIFGPWYEDVLPKRKPDVSNEPDFVLKRFDGFLDIVEIEAPGKPIFTNPDKSGKMRPRAELTQALTQVINYIDLYNENYMKEFYNTYQTNVENPLNPYKPKGLVIIGRDKKPERKHLRQFNSYLNNVTIVTYDEFLHNSETILEFVAHQIL